MKDRDGTFIKRFLTKISTIGRKSQMKLPVRLGNSDRQSDHQTNQPNDQPTDGHEGS